jgi:hypothetical protein
MSVGVVGGVVVVGDVGEVGVVVVVELPVSIWARAGDANASALAAIRRVFMMFLRIL